MDYEFVTLSGEPLAGPNSTSTNSSSRSSLYSPQDARIANDEVELEHLTRYAVAADNQDLIDDTGSALHRAVKEKNIEALKTLLEVPNIDLNYNKQGFTALSLAIEEIGETPPYMYQRNDVEEQMKILECMIKLLLEAGCDVKTRDRWGRTPLYSAAAHGLKKVIEMITSNSDEPIHVLLQPHEDILQSIASGTHIKNSSVDFNWCMDLILNNASINVNQIDDINNTALHYAASYGDEEIVLKLLRHGACVGLRNYLDEMPLAYIKAKTLETYFDECITDSFSRNKATDEHYKIHINYNFLAYQNNCEPCLCCEETDANLVHETDALLYMTQNEELCPLLKHPVITSFLYLKWQRINCLAYANITTYSILWLFLILYLLFGYCVEKKQSDSFEVLNIVTYVGVIIGLILLIIRELFQLLLSPVRYLQGYENWMELVLIVIIASIVRHDSELRDVSIKQQLSAVAILISSAELLLLIGQFPASSTNILMLKTVSWNFFKFLLWYCLLIIAFALSFYTLFRQVEDDQTPLSKNLNCTEEKEEFFKDPFRALFKTIVMLTGEFDAGSIQFNTFPVTSHIIFIVFVFMIPIVLFNLLNGLAVSDIQKIRADAELVALITRVKLISYLESILLGNAKTCKKPIICWSSSWLTTHLQDLNTRIHNLKVICIKPLVKHISIFQHLPTHSIIVKPNQDNKIRMSRYSEPLIVLRDEFRTKLNKENISFKGKLDAKIVQNAKIIISRKKNVTRFDEIKDSLLQNKSKIENVITKIEILETSNKSLNQSLNTKVERLETTINKVLEKLETSVSIE